MTHDGHLLILLYSPSLEEALAYFIYCEDQLAAHGADVETRTSAFEVAYSRFGRTAQP